MDQVLNALKCANCMEILSSPVVLPCGHTICRAHTEVDDEQIICAECGSRHQNKGFIVNEVVAKMIKAQLSKLNFGHQHNEASKSCRDLKKQLDKNDAMFNDLDYFIHESIEELKNRVMLRSEHLKVRIDEITQELIIDLNEYETRCKRNCGGINNDVNFTSMLNELKELNEKTKESWKDWSTVLNELNVDVEKWSNIKEESDSTLKKMCEKLKHFEKELFMKELDVKKVPIEVFEKANIDTVLKIKSRQNNALESMILDYELSIEFLELCDFKIDQKFKLLYRGSRDGFKAADFHSKCDNQPNTVTVIETTTGFIFGGYTQACWASNEQYAYDAKAYLFSLVNPFKKPFVSHVVSPANAIYNGSIDGPCFGSNTDIDIRDNSNTSKNNCGVSSFYQKPNDINDPKGIYFCDDQNFMVKEIEVFQINNV